MADFYKECSRALALCECCGPVVVDIDGKRMPGQEFNKGCKCAERAK